MVQICIHRFPECLQLEVVIEFCNSNVTHEERIRTQVAGGSYQEGFGLIPAQFSTAIQGRRLSQAAKPPSLAPAPGPLASPTPALRYVATGSPSIYGATIEFRDPANGTVRIQCAPTHPPLDLCLKTLLSLPPKHLQCAWVCKGRTGGGGCPWNGVGVGGGGGWVPSNSTLHRQPPATCQTTQHPPPTLL